VGADTATRARASPRSRALFESGVGVWTRATSARSACGVASMLVPAAALQRPECMRARARTHTHTHTHTHKCADTYTHTHTPSHARARAHTHTHTHIHARARAPAHVRMHASARQTSMPNITTSPATMSPGLPERQPRGHQQGGGCAAQGGGREGGPQGSLGHGRGAAGVGGAAAPLVGRVSLRRPRESTRRLYGQQYRAAVARRLADVSLAMADTETPPPNPARPMHIMLPNRACVTSLAIHSPHPCFVPYDPPTVCDGREHRQGGACTSTCGMCTRTCVCVCVCVRTCVRVHACVRVRACARRGGAWSAQIDGCSHGQGRGQAASNMAQAGGGGHARRV
jgi:hypothetical protein